MATIRGKTSSSTPAGTRNADQIEAVGGSETPLVQQDSSFGLFRPSQPPSSFDELDGANGFVLNGIDPGDLSGRSVSGAGDVDGDGFEDLIIGAPFADPTDDEAGESYVVFGGTADVGASLELSDLNGGNGFTMVGEPDVEGTGALLGFPVDAAGDVNGDGFGDVIVAARRATPYDLGDVYVVFGNDEGFPPRFQPIELDGGDGFAIVGSNDDYEYDFAVSSAGDIDGDGFDDLVVGDPFAGESGRIAVIFGTGSFDPVVNVLTLDGTDGFLVQGEPYSFSGESVSSAGDLNGDGFADVVIGSEENQQSFVVFGRADGFEPTLQLENLDEAEGFTVDGAGGDVNSGDINGDGLTDLIIGASTASHVIFGRTDGFGGDLNVSELNGGSGFAIDGAGFDVSMAGDVNGDGFDDLIIGDPAAGSGGEGAAYVVYGGAGPFPASLDLANLDPDEGFAIAGIDPLDGAGGSVSAAGDIDGDGFDDLVVGAPGGDPDGDSEAGESYVVFGGNFTGEVTHPGASTNDTLIGDADANVMVGGRGDDLLIGNGGLDVLLGGAGDDLLAIADDVLQRLDGGTGIDTLQIVGSGTDLDLTGIFDPEIQDIERIDLTGSGDNSLTVNAQDVLNLSDTSNTLTVLGNAGDTLTAVGDWGPGIDNGDFILYAVDEALLSVDDEVDVQVSVA